MKSVLEEKSVDHIPFRPNRSFRIRHKYVLAFFCILSLLFVCQTTAAEKNLSIEGMVVDLRAKGVPHADVIIFKEGEEKPLKHLLADEHGKFNIVVGAGTYRVEAFTNVRGVNLLVKKKVRYLGKPVERIQLTIPTGGLGDIFKQFGTVISVITTILIFMAGYLMAILRDRLTRKRVREAAVSIYLHPVNELLASISGVSGTLRENQQAAVQTELREKLYNVGQMINNLLEAPWTHGSLKSEFFGCLLAKKNLVAQLQGTVPFAESAGDSVTFLVALNAHQEIAAWQDELRMFRELCENLSDF